MSYDEVLPGLRAFYERNAAERDQVAKAPWKVEERQRFLACLQAEQKQSLLEIGAGTGQDSLFFQQNGLQVVCTDLSPAMVERCRQKGLTAYVMDFLGLDFPAHSFDALYALNCLLHVPRQELPAVLHTLWTLLKPAGLFYLGLYGGADEEGVFGTDGPEQGRFFSYHSRETLSSALEPLFEILYCKTIDFDAGSREHFHSLILRKTAAGPGD